MTVKERFPNPILNRVRRLPKGFHGLYLCDPFPKDNKVFDNWEFHDIKVVNEQNFIKKGKLIDNPPRLVLFPNYFGVTVLKGMVRELRSTVPLLQSTESQRLCFYFLDEHARGDARVRNLISVPLQIYIGIVDNEVAILYSIKKLDESERYWIKAVRIPITSVVNGDKLTTYRYFIISSRQFKEDLNDVKDLKFKSMYDFCLVWDFDRNVPVYDDIETFIIMSSCIFVKPSFPAINLILCGETSSKKTAWFDTFKEIFGDDYAVSQWSSIKGLIISFYGEHPRAGIIFNAKFVSMIDEFFRRFLSDSQSIKREGAFQVLRNGLSDFMNVVEHKKFPFSSGKGSMDLILKTSFMATDNAIYKNEIPKVWNKDKAVLRRFSWLLVGDDTVRKGQQMMLIDVDEAKRLLQKKWRKDDTFDSMAQFGRFCKYARQEIFNMQFDDDDKKYVNNLLEQVRGKYKTTFFVDTSARALYFCFKFFSKHMPLDRAFFEKAFWRLVEDANSILEPKGWKETTDVVSTDVV